MAAPRFTRVLLIVAGVLLAIVLVAWAALAILFPPAKVRALAQRQLGAALAREVRFDDASVSIFPPVRLRVAGLALAEPGGFANGAAFQTRTLNLDLDVLALIGGRVVVRRLDLDHPALHLVLRTDGTTNLDGLSKPPPAGAPPAKPMDFAVRELAIDGGRLLVDDVRNARRIACGLGTRLGLSSESGGKRLSLDGRTTLSNLAFGPLSARSTADLNSSLAKLEWKIEHAGKYDAGLQRLALTRLALEFGRTEIALRGVVDHPGPQAVVGLEAQGMGIDLGEILGFLSAADTHLLNGISGAGQLDFQLAVRGSVAGGAIPAVTGPLRLRDARFKYAGAPAAVEALQFTANFGGNSLDISDLSARVASQPIRARLHVENFADPSLDLALQGNLDLAAIGPLVAPKDTKLAGRADVDVRVRGRARDPAAMNVDGRAKLAAVSVETPALPKKLEDLHGDIAFSQTRAQVTGLGARAGQSSFTLDGTVDRPLSMMAAQKSDGSFPTPAAAVKFDLRSPYLDAAEIMPSSGGAPVLPNATGGGNVSIGRLKNGALDVRNVAASVALAPAVLSVPSFAMDGYGGKIGGNARFDLTQPKSPAFDVKAKLDTLQADALLSAWTPAKGLLRGVLSTDLNLSGAGGTPEALKRTLTAVGLAALANGQLGPGPALEAIAQVTRIPDLKQMYFKDAKLPFKIERGRFVTDAGHLNGPYGEWLIAGGVGFDGALDYAVSITLPPSAVAALEAKSALAAGALADDQGRMLLDLKVAGSARAPRVTWDTDAMKARLMGRASAAIEEQRTRLEAEARAALVDRQQAAAESARAALQRLQGSAADSARTRITDVLKGFFAKTRNDSLAK